MYSTQTQSTPYSKQLLLWLTSLLPALSLVDNAERLRSCAGALLGILFTGLVSAAFLGTTTSAIWLAAPMGASAVLLFAVPASPLAQPWSIVGGNLVAALIGVTCAKFIGVPVLAAAVAIFFAIAAMFALRCIHPPSGAVALTAVLGGPAVHITGYWFVLMPVALNTVILLLIAIGYNKATGRRYPHVHIPLPIMELKNQAMTHEGATQRTDLIAQDLAEVLKDYNQVLDISVDDLEALFHQTERKAFNRRFGSVLCGHLMSKDIVSAEFATELAAAWELIQTHGVQALPVVDRAKRVVGIVTRTDFLHHAQLQSYQSLAQRFGSFLRKTTETHSDKHEVVGQIMSKHVKTVYDTTPIADLVPLMSELGLHHVPVVNEKQQLIGMLTQTELIGALYEASLVNFSN